jgi:hypothetical protein
MIERASSGAIPAEERVGMPSGLPTVRSADLGRAEPVSELTPEERADLDAKAAALGIKDIRLGNVETDGIEFAGNYASEEDVQAELLASQKALVANTGRIDTTQPNIIAGGRQTAREFLRIQPVLPDFRMVESVNFGTDMMYVGGMAFPMKPDFQKYLRKLVIEQVVAEVQSRLTAALEAEVPSAETNTPGGPEVS